MIELEDDDADHEVEVARTDHAVMLRIDDHEMWMSPREAIEIGTSLRDMGAECMGPAPKEDRPS